MWSDREINPGVDWEKEIVQHLDSADIILILVSAAYYNSAYIHEKEIKYAINRHERGETKVLPVIVRPCHFLDDPVISRLQVLPTDGKPVTDRRHWAERDDAWLDVVAGVKRTIDALRNAELRYEQAVQNKKESEKRAREEQAHHEREATVHAENERLAQLRREQEEAALAASHQYNKDDSYENPSIQADNRVARLYVKREFSLASSLRDMGVYVDGKRLGTVENGGSAEFLIPYGRRNISVKVSGFFSDLLQVDIGENQALTILVGASWLNPKPFVRVS
jgi:hypothetical protein